MTSSGDGDGMSSLVPRALRYTLLTAQQASLGSGVGDAGACAAVAKVMAMYPDDRLIQKEGCRAIEALSDGDERNVERLGEAVSAEVGRGDVEGGGLFTS